MATYDAREDLRVAESLGQMQKMLAQIMKRTDADEHQVALRPQARANRLSSSCEPVEPTRSVEAVEAVEPAVSTQQPAGDKNGLSTPDSSSATAAAELQQQQLPLPPPPPSRAPSAGATPRFADTCRTLHAAFPPQQDVSVLFEAGRAAIYLQALCNPYNELFAEGHARSLAAMSDLPPVTVHPIILARKLLHLALCIQQLDAAFDPSALRLGQPIKDAMRHYFDLATSLVTCHDELLDSLEGLECLICEAVYLVNSGNLRRALLSLRRALTLAQFMGFHARPAPGPLPQHDPATRVSGAVTWVHLAWLERFVSLLLGLPTSITGVRLAPAQKPGSETCSEWMEKVQVDMCARIMQRNQETGDGDQCRIDYAVTQRIDRELNVVADSLPSTWWSPLDFHPGIGINDMMERMISAQIQIVHFTLVAMLHLPYLLCRPTADTNGSSSGSGNQLSYSKSACTFACREVLTRFIEFRSIVRVVFCCRPVDFCALATALVLLVAHLSGQRDADSGWLLPHHRRGDRALIRKAIDTMADLNRLNNDELSRETADLAQRLLDLEDSRDRLTYSANALPPMADATADTVTAAKDEKSLLLHIPYFGAVRLTCEPASPALQTSDSFTMTNSVTTTPATTSVTPPQAKESRPYEALTLAYTDMTSSSSENNVFLTDATSFVPDTLPVQTMQTQQAYFTTQPFHTIPPHSQSHLPTQVEQPLPFLCYNPIIPPHEVEGDLFGYDSAMPDLPDLMAGTDAWAFQGVDATVFDNLIRGANYPFYS